MTDNVRKLDFRSKLTHKQTLAWDALARSDIKEVLYGGAKGGLENSELINKFNSAEYAFFFLDQAEEIDAEQIGELRATFRLIINGVKVPGKGLFTANPAPSFLKDEFILNPTPDRLFIQALPTDNHLMNNVVVLGYGRAGFIWISVIVPPKSCVLLLR